MASVLTILAITLAWLAFRVERRERRQVQVAEALGILTGVREGIVTAPAHFNAPDGWGGLYFKQGLRLRESLCARQRDSRPNPAEDAIRCLSCRRSLSLASRPRPRVRDSSTLRR